jgi:hypothetical protein
MHRRTLIPVLLAALFLGATAEARVGAYVGTGLGHMDDSLAGSCDGAIAVVATPYEFGTWTLSFAFASPCPYADTTNTGQASTGGGGGFRAGYGWLNGCSYEWVIAAPGAIWLDPDGIASVDGAASFYYNVTGCGTGTLTPLRHDLRISGTIVFGGASDEV